MECPVKEETNLRITAETADELDNVFETKENELEEKVEAALFIAGKFLTLQDLIVLTDINPIMLKEILRKLERKYSHGAIALINKSNSWKMDVAEKYKDLINRLATGKTEFTKAEQETLAVIAYKQPVKQSIIIRIRGNKAYDHIKKFIELNLVTTKSMGHTIELNLSEDFYEYFNLQQREKLIENAESIGKIPENEANENAELEEKEGIELNPKQPIE